MINLPRQRLRSSIGIYISISLLFIPLLVKAQDFSIQPRVMAGTMYYDYNHVIQENETKSKGIINDFVPFAGIGASLTYHRLFFDFKMLKTSTGTDQTHITPFGLPDGETIDFQRTEYAIAGGYYVTDRWLILAGYSDTETEFDWEIPVEEDENPVNPANQNFEINGPFVGINYNWAIGNSGRLIFDFIVSKLDSKVTHIDQGFLMGQVVERDVEDDGITYTFGINWVAPINNKWNYKISLSTYRYKFENGNARLFNTVDNSPIKNDDLDLEYSFEETVTSLTLSLNYQF